MSPQDKAIQAFLANPSAESLPPLLRAVGDSVYNLCFQILRRREDAEDAAQEVLVEIARDGNQIREGRNFRRWLYKVCLNTALDHLRARRRRVEAESARTPSTPSLPANGDALFEALAKVGDGDRTLLVEHYFEGVSLTEMAAREGCSKVAVWKRIEKARSRLKLILGATGLGLAALLLATPPVVAPSRLVPNSIDQALLALGGLTVTTKTGLSVAAAVILAVFLIGGFAWIAVDRKSVQTASAPAEGGRASETIIPETVALAETMPPRVERPTAERRRQWTLEKLQEYGARFREFQDDQRARGYRVEPATPGDQSQPTESARNAEKLLGNVTRLRQELEEHASGSASGQPWALFDPMTCLEFFKTTDGLFVRMSLLTVIRPSMEAEISSEESPSGPVLDAVIQYAHGDFQDKMFLLFLTKALKITNQSLGDSYFQLLNDSNRSVRHEALAAMSEQSVKGNLKATFTRHVPLLLQLATEGEGNQFPTRDRWPGDNDRIRGGACQILTTVGTPEIDEFLVQQMEAVGLVRAQALSASAPRLFKSHAPRTAAVVRRVIDASTEESQRYWTVRFSALLPEAEGVECLRYLAARLPAVHPEAAAGLESIIGRIERGEGAAVVRDMEKLRDAFWGKDFLSTFPKLSSPTSN